MTNDLIDLDQDIECSEAEKALTSARTVLNEALALVHFLELEGDAVNKFKTRAEVALFRIDEYLDK